MATKTFQQLFSQLQMLIYNLKCQMERFPKPLDLFHLPIWGSAHGSGLEREGS